MATLEDVKTLLSVTDVEQDEVISLIIKNVEQRLKRLLGAQTIPDELGYIVTEVSVSRFNRLGSEGMKSDNVEGYGVTYATVDDFIPYMNDIEAFTSTEKESRSGWAVML